MIQGKYSKEVASLETREGCPIEPGNELTKPLFLVPSAQNTTSRKGIALDGNVKSGDIHLASSTLAAAGKEIEKIGILVSYTVYVELDCGTFGGVVVAEVPLKLINPTPGSIASERALASRKMQSLEERRHRNSLYESDNNLVYRGRRPSVYEPDE
jgi:arrestin-2